MNIYQRKLCETYGGGDYAHYVTEHADDWRDALPDCGDGLFSFLMIELSDREDCEDLETAIQRTESAARQLQAFATALAKLELN